MLVLEPWPPSIIRSDALPVQLRELEQELLKAKRSGSEAEAARADLEAQFIAAREERDSLVASVSAAAATDAQSAESTSDAMRQVREIAGIISNVIGQGA